jgi:hypothetical protein
MMHGLIRRSASSAAQMLVDDARYAVGVLLQLREPGSRRVTFLAWRRAPARTKGALVRMDGFFPAGP